MRLVADIGGTNSRLAMSENGVVLKQTTQSYSNKDWNGFDEILAHYLSRIDAPRPDEIVLAVAGPVHSDRAQLTNRGWVFDTAQLQREFGTSRTQLLNDLTALGYAVPNLRPNQVKIISTGNAQTSTVFQSLVVGVGTGFNVSPVLQNAGKVVCPAVEAGHVGLPYALFTKLDQLGFKHNHFSTTEDLFSGRGFREFCAFLTDDKAMEGTEFIAAFGAPEAAPVTEAINHYATLLGFLLRDLSLAYMPTSGLYLAGSVARSILATAPNPCIEVLQAPFDMQAVKAPPVWVIQDDMAALAGCVGFEFG